jgi:ribonuclease-3
MAQPQHFLLSRDAILALRERLGLDISLELLERPFRHSSYVNENAQKMESNERLEFLGDAVVELVISAYLYENFPDLSEGELTKIKSVVVSGPVLAEKAKDLDLDRCLLLGRGEEESGGRARSSILGDAFEALVGIIYSVQSYEKAAQLVLDALRPEIERVAQGQHRRDYKTLLQELAQELGNKPYYSLLDAAGEDHRKEFTVRVIVAHQEGIGRGRSKKEAEQAAAKQLYFKLEGRHELGNEEAPSL